MLRSGLKNFNGRTLHGQAGGKHALAFLGAGVVAGGASFIAAHGAGKASSKLYSKAKEKVSGK
jgi:hypothetical protein